MLLIREMTIADYDSVMALWRTTQSMTLREADSRRNIEAYLKRNAGLSFIALNGSTVVGAVLVGTDGRRGYLQHLAVALGFRGNTIGKQLVAQSVSALEGMGILKTHLFVHNDNAEAQEFYKSLGWYLRDDVQMYSFNNSDRDNV